LYIEDKQKGGLIETIWHY